MSDRFENPLTEFVALACYTARHNLNRPTLAHGVIEKMAVLTAYGYGVHIENMDAHVWRHGSQVRYRRRRVVLREPPISLLQMSSNYFRQDAGDDGAVFSCSERFERDLTQLSTRKTYLSEYESCILELLRIYALDGGFENLLYLSMLCTGDGGVGAAAGDLEVILDEILEYVRTEVYLVDRRRHKEPLKTMDAVRRTHDSLRRKLSLLRRSEALQARLSAACKSVRGQRLLQKARFLPPDCHFWNLIERLAESLMAVAQALLIEGHDLPLYRPQLATVLDEALVSVRKLSGPGPERDLAPSEDEVVSTAEALGDAVDRWLRALASLDDAQYFEKYTLNEVSRVLRPFVVSYDGRDYMKVLQTAVREESPAGTKTFEEWRRKLQAIPRNWSILFGGCVEGKDGDKEIAQFTTMDAALESLALVLVHFDLLRLLSPRLTLGVKAGLGEGPAIVLVDGSHSVVVNALYHAIERLSDLDVRTQGSPCTAVVLRHFVAEHPQLTHYELGRFQFKDGQAVRIDYRRVLADFIQRVGTK